MPDSEAEEQSEGSKNLESQRALEQGATSRLVLRMDVCSLPAVVLMSPLQWHVHAHVRGERN